MLELTDSKFLNSSIVVTCYIWYKITVTKYYKVAVTRITVAAGRRRQKRVSPRAAVAMGTVRHSRQEHVCVWAEVLESATKGGDMHFGDLCDALTVVFVGWIVWQMWVNPLDAQFIYLATSAECTGRINRPTSQRVRFHKQFKIMKSHYFWIFMYIWWFLKFLFFVCEKLAKCAAMPKLPNW